jgi:hypothetical protein
MSTTRGDSRARLGLHHVTVVPSNYDADGDDPGTDEVGR